MEGRHGQRAAQSRVSPGVGDVQIAANICTRPRSRDVRALRGGVVRIRSTAEHELFADRDFRDIDFRSTRGAPGNAVVRMIRRIFAHLSDGVIIQAAARVKCMWRGGAYVVRGW